MITAEELGNIASRIALADSRLSALLMEMATEAEERMLPDDKTKLAKWIQFIHIMRHVLELQEKPE